MSRANRPDGSGARPARPFAALVLLALLATAAPLSAAATEEEPSAYAPVDGVTYFLAAGLVNGSALTHDAGGGERALDFQGCAFVQFRPAFGRGRVAIDGVLDGEVPLRLEMSEFEGPGSGVEANVTVDAARDPALPPGGRARAEIAASGIAQMHAGIVTGDRGQPVLGNFTDPLTGEQELAASVFVTRDGSRDGDGALQGEVERGDAEVHVVVASPPGARSQADRAAFGPAAALPGGAAMPNSEHIAEYAFRNTRFGGVAKVVLTVTAPAGAPGSNEIAVAVYAPDGFQAANGTASASALGPGRAEMEVALDQVGDYIVVANGRLLMGNYRVDVELLPPAAFKLDFWWEAVERGEAARAANSQCMKDLGLRAQVVSGAVLRNPPPRFPMELVVLAVLVSVSAGLFLVRLGYEQFSSSEFQRSFKK